jgi:hypothetical protein
MKTQVMKDCKHGSNDVMLVIQPYPGGKIHSVPQEVFEKILTKILSRLHEFERDTDYTAIELCTKAFWEKEIEQSVRKCAGKYIALMVEADRLPMRPNGINPSSKAKLYRLK